MKASRYTTRRAIAILGEAVREGDGQVLLAASRLGMYPTKASSMALRAFYALHEDPWRQLETCAAAESAMVGGWCP